MQKRAGNEIPLAVLDAGEFFGEMAIFEQEVRSATVRAIKDVRVLTIDKKNFLEGIHKDPSLAFHIVKSMSHRLRLLDQKHTRIRASDRRDWKNRPEKLTGED